MAAIEDALAPWWTDTSTTGNPRRVEWFEIPVGRIELPYPRAPFNRQERRAAASREKRAGHNGSAG